MAFKYFPNGIDDFGSIHFRNKIVLSLEPEEKIAIHFWSKKPGFAYDLEERTLSFLLRESEKHSQYVEEYKKLLLDCITGDQTLFVSTEEVREMWRFTDPIIDAWRERAVPLETYAPDANAIAMRADDFAGGIHALPKQSAAAAQKECAISINVWVFVRNAESADNKPNNY